jgi:hypothetical protein
VSGGYVTASGSMNRWRLGFVGSEELLAEPNINTDWTVVDELSNVDVSRLDLGVGGRWRTGRGLGFEIAGRYTDYSDDDPILEDETGKFYSVTTLVSYGF